MAVYATWRLSYDKLDASARSFLQICSLLHHEGISEQMFKQAALSPLRLAEFKLQNEVTQLLEQLGKHDSQWCSWEFLQVVKSLRSCSFIEYDDRNCMYSVHPLVQHWSGTTIGNQKKDMKICVLSIIGLSVPWTLNKEYIHQHTLLKHITNCMGSLNPKEIDPLVALHLALVFYEQGHWGNAEVLQMTVMEKRMQALGENHPDTLQSMGGLCGIYRN